MVATMGVFKEYLSKHGAIFYSLHNDYIGKGKCESNLKLGFNI